MFPSKRRSPYPAVLVLIVAVGLSADTRAKPIQVRLQKNVMMPARDGVRLATDIYLPDGETTPAGPFPTILIRTPYGKSGLATTAEHFTTHGYAVVVQDVRGRFDSEGRFYIYVNEGEDGFDAVAWAGRQPWCNGRVGTWGGSYLAATQNALAVLRPPHLRTMFVLVGTSNYIEDGAGRGGAFALLHNMAYAFRLAYTGKSTTANKPSTGAPGLQGLNEAYGKLGDWLRAAPLKKNNPLAAAPDYAQWYADWRAHPTDDAYWQQNGYNFEVAYDRFPQIPICFVGGWYDIFKRGTLNNFRGLHQKNPHTRLVIGPWTHSTGLRYAGDVDFGKAAIRDLKKAAVTWFDRFLKPDKAPPRPGPAVEYFVMAGGPTQKNHAGRLQSGGAWKQADHWPLADHTERRFYLTPNQQLLTEPPAQSAEIVFEADPRNPIPTIGGNLDSGKQLVRRGAQNQILRQSDFGANNQLPLSARSDVVTFQTAPLTEPVEIAGPIRLELFVSSLVPDADVTAKLIDVFPPSNDYPSGYHMNLEDGILRLRFRNSRKTETLLRPGVVYPIVIDLWATANRFAAGHRIRVDIAGSNFPMYDVNPNTGEPLGRHTRLRVARNTIHVGPQQRSALVVSVAPKRP